MLRLAVDYGQYGGIVPPSCCRLCCLLYVPPVRTSVWPRNGPEPPILLGQIQIITPRIQCRTYPPIPYTLYIFTTLKYWGMRLLIGPGQEREYKYSIEPYDFWFLLLCLEQRYFLRTSLSRIVPRIRRAYEFEKFRIHSHSLISIFIFI